MMTEKEEGVLDIIRASKKADASTGKGKSVPRLPAEKKKADEFWIGDLDIVKRPKNLLRAQ